MKQTLANAAYIQYRYLFITNCSIYSYLKIYIINTYILLILQYMSENIKSGKEQESETRPDQVLPTGERLFYPNLDNYGYHMSVCWDLKFPFLWIRILVFTLYPYSSLNQRIFLNMIAINIFFQLVSSFHSIQFCGSVSHWIHAGKNRIHQKQKG